MSSGILINPSIIWNLIRKDFGSIKVLYMKCHESKYFCVIFRQLKNYQDQNFLI